MMLKVEKAHAYISNIIEENQQVEIIADESDGLIFTEGPIWDSSRQELTFSDIPGNEMYRWSEQKGLETFVPFSFKGNGSAFDLEKNIITCEHATSRLVKRNYAGEEYEILCSHYNGKELNSPNDVVVKSDGSIYFTDPFFGRNYSKVGVGRKQQLDFQGVYRYCEGGLVLLVDFLKNPNGLCFSADEKRLFVNDTPEKNIWVFDVKEDGSVHNGKIWATTSGTGPGLPDGMKLDINENLYCCAQGGIHVFNKEGEILGRILFPVQVANFTFGGKDGKDLFVCATDRVYRIKGKISGLLK